MLIKCPACRHARNIDDAKIPASAVLATCPKCKTKFIFRTIPQEKIVIEPDFDTGPFTTDRPGQTMPEDDDIRRYDSFLAQQDEYQALIDEEKSKTVCPWEKAGKGQYFSALLKTIGWIIFSPRSFFMFMPVSGGLKRPLLFALIINLFQIFFRLLWALSAGNAQEVVAEESNAADIGASTYILIFVLLAFTCLAFLFIHSALLHSALRIFRINITKFEITFRIFCYASAPMIIGAVPFIGGIVAMLWTLICVTIGCRYVYKSAYNQVVPAIVMSTVAIIGVYLCAVLSLTSGVKP